MIQLLGSVIGGLFKVGDKLIEDKDKKMEFAFKLQEMSHELAVKLLDTKTYPWVDALVKLAYASEALIKGLFRPIISAALTGFIIYAEMEGINISPTMEIILGSAFPGWMASRHAEKKRKKAEEQYGELGW